MAEGEGTSFENPTYEPDPWDDDGDETAPFFPNGASTPAFGQSRGQEQIEMKTMQHEKGGQPDTSYVETSFGARTSSERAWGPFLEAPGNYWARQAVLFSIPDESFRRFENFTVKVSASLRNEIDFIRGQNTPYFS